MFDILPNSAVPSDIELTKDQEDAKEKARKVFHALPRTDERDSVLSALGRMGKSGLKHKIRHRAKCILDTVNERSWCATRP
jgi:hypothetical protein